MPPRMVKLELQTGKCYQGRDYYAGDAVEVEEPWARRWLLSGAARLAPETPPLPPPPPLSAMSQVEVIQTRDPKPRRRR